MDAFTEILERAQHGDRAASEQLATALYDELRALARRELARERPGHTLQPTALVHEAWLRLCGGRPGNFDGRGHFYASAARAIRRILVEHARRRRRDRRGGDLERVTLTDDMLSAPDRDADLLVLDEALERLAAVAPDKARLVELRFFAGMTLEEAARALGVSESTVVRDWRLARAWLQAELDDASDER